MKFKFKDVDGSHIRNENERIRMISKEDNPKKKSAGEEREEKVKQALANLN